MGAALALSPGKLGLFSVMVCGRPYSFHIVQKMGKGVPSALFQMRSILKPASIAGKLNGYKHISLRLNSNL